MNPDLCREWIVKRPELVVRLGGSPDSWTIVDVGDGNLNFVWVVTGEKETLIAKKAPPFVRVLPEWPMSETRIQFECQALAEQVKWVPQLVPHMHAFDHKAAIIVMDYLSPHIILRKGLMAAIEYPNLAKDIGEFLAQTLFHTSTLYLKNTEQRADAARYMANQMIYVTEQLVFHEPYMIAKNNHWTDHPDLHKVVAAIQADTPLKLQVAHYHEKFQNQGQALVHADLHTGSIMVTAEKTAIIDPEFAFYGPMGFDIGAFLGNLFLSYFSQDGLANQDKEPKNRKEYKQWLLKTVVQSWNEFQTRFIKLWDTEHQVVQSWNEFQTRFVKLWNTEHNGSLYVHFGKDSNSEEKKLAQNEYLNTILADSIAYAGIKMIRRVVGFAHVADLDSIEDINSRVPCEIKALEFARNLVLKAKTFKSIEEVTKLFE